MEGAVIHMVKERDGEGYVAVRDVEVLGRGLVDAVECYNGAKVED